MTNTQKPNAPRLILASASPRRRELLAGLERPFEVIVPAIDETPWPAEAPANYVLRLAHEKALAVLARCPGPEPLQIIAADTSVVLGDRILGKPADPADAAAMLRDLSGRGHVVMTGLSLVERTADGSLLMRGDAAHTTVVFRDVTETEIHHYVATGEPMDKAGAYAIQGGAAGMVAHIDGSYSNVVGLPMERLTEWLT
jgi:septum formation protein